MYNVVKIDKTKGKVATDVNLATLRDGRRLFHNNTNITNWTVDMPNLENGLGMFQNNTNLTSFTGNLDSLENGYYMFYYSSQLTSFVSSLPSLKNGTSMFIICNLSKDWSIEMPNLETAPWMFQANMNFKRFLVDLPNLVKGESMFTGAQQLIHFRGILPKLSDGKRMFGSCRLDSRSVLCIISSVPTWTSGEHLLTIGCACSDDDESKDAYAQEIGYESFTALNDAFIAKGWTVTWQFNGPAAANYSLRNPRPEPKKVFAKISEIDEDVAIYTDGEKFYNLDWGHVVNDDSYEEFESFEGALEHFNLTEVNRNLGDE